jgi:hypothetical protein
MSWLSKGDDLSASDPGETFLNPITITAQWRSPSNSRAVGIDIGVDILIMGQWECEKHGIVSDVRCERSQRVDRCDLADLSEFVCLFGRSH